MTSSSLLIPPLLFCLLFLPAASAATKNKRHLTSFSISDSPWLPTDNLTLLSPNHTFAAGFRRFPLSPSLFLFSIWVRASSQRTIIWSLNPTNPISSSTPLSISAAGRLFLRNPAGHNLFPSSASGPPNSSKLLLTDNGNLVFNNWTSFASPTDTILPNQLIPSNGTALVSGKYTFVNATALVFNNNNTSYWSASNIIFNLTSDGALFTAGSKLMAADSGDVVLRRLTLDPDGNLRIYSLNEASGEWRMVWQAVTELCTIPGTCGLNAICMPNRTTTYCKCPPGYTNIGDSQCTLKTTYLPSSKFLRLDYVQFPGGSDNIKLEPANFDRCQSHCLANFTCVAFSYKFDGQQTCLNFFNQLIYGYWSPVTEISTFLRVESSELDVNTFTGMTSMIGMTCPANISLPIPPKESKTTARNIAIIVTLFTIELLVAVLSFWAFLRKYSMYRNMAQTFGLELLPAGGPRRFSYAELKSATNDFSDVVGRGGYGIVYRGQLPDGRDIAVKRLKNDTGGGEAEFWAEVTIIARMHHLNLVRMWGFCAEKEQRMLVYEYISNGSLDKFLFQKETGNEDRHTGKEEVLPRKPILDWNIRYRIAIGVARAIAYLHEECLEWVLHCDIKPENILLGDDFCPKVSDFGLSKLTNKKDMVRTSHIRGTRGYLAPEWVLRSDRITAKADVYSFGVVLLEIVTGARSYEFRRESVDSEDWYLPRWAFDKAYVERKVEDMLDHWVMESYDNREHSAMVERMVKTAIWCLQDREEMRPSMGKVTKMLEGTVEITEPGKPTIFYLPEESASSELRISSFSSPPSDHFAPLSSFLIHLFSHSFCSFLVF